MRDSLTAFAVCDPHDSTSLSTRTQKSIPDALRGAKVTYRETAQTATALDTPKPHDFFAGYQSVAAFNELDRRRADTTDIEAHLQTLRAKTVIKNSRRIADRTANLLELYKEDYGGKSLSSSSIATFLEFLDFYQNSKFPTITATPAGELYVQWKHDENQRLGIQFLSGSSVKWVLFKRNIAHAEQIDYLSGQTMVDSFRETATALGIDEWIIE